MKLFSRENMITLNYIHHSEAKEKLREKLLNKGVTEEWIKELNIATSGGYVMYKVKLIDDTIWKILDNGDDFDHI